MMRRLARPLPHRRGFLTAAAGLLGVSALGGCDRFAASPTGRNALKVGEETVRSHLKAVYARLGLAGQADLIRFVTRLAPFAR